MKRRPLLALAGLSPLLAATPARAFPDRTITLIVPFAPGGSTDIAARFIADRWAQRVGQRVLVENRAGAGGGIASEFVKRAAPDGHVLLMASASTHGVNPAVFSDLPYDAMADFAPVALTGVTPMILMVPPQGVRDLEGLRALLAAGRSHYASAGVGSVNHLAAELLLARLGAKADHVPYRGGGPAMEAIARGEVPWAFESLATVSGPARDGRVRLLGIATAARSPSEPDLKTLAELGVAGVEVSTWNAVLAPAGTPAARLDALASSLQATLGEPDLVARLAQIGVAVPPPTGPAATARFIAADIAKFRAVAEAAGVKLERP